MNRKIHPGILLLPLIAIAVVCFSLYIASHPIVLPKLPEERVNTQTSATVSGQLMQVEKVVDGDTIDVVVDGKKTAVRFIGINAPETYQGKTPECFAEEASRYVKDRIEGKPVSLIADTTQDNTDKYDRLLRYIIMEDGTNLNLDLIQKGYAREYTYKIPYQYQQEFRDAQSIAKKNAVGLWNTCYK